MFPFSFIAIKSQDLKKITFWLAAYLSMVHDFRVSKIIPGFRLKSMITVS